MNKYGVETHLLTTVAKEAQAYGFKYIVAADGTQTSLDVAPMTKQARSRGWTLAHSLRIGDEKPFPALVKYTKDGNQFGYYKLERI